MDVRDRERAALLTRIVRQLPADFPAEDVDALLAWVEELIGAPETPLEEPEPPVTPTPVEIPPVDGHYRYAGLMFPVPIWARYKGQRVDGELHADGMVTVDGEKFSSPSVAGRPITGYIVNGWRFWKCADPRTGQPTNIDIIREYIRQAEDRA